MNPFKLEKRDDKTYLVYSKGNTRIERQIQKSHRTHKGLVTLLKGSDYLDLLKVEDAFYHIRCIIRVQRQEARAKQDALLNRPRNHYLSQYQNKLDKAMRLLRESKNPISRSKQVGVEIEFLSNAPRHNIMKALIKADLADKVCLKSDGSLHETGCPKLDGDDEEEFCECSSSRMFELTLVAKNTEVKELVSKVCTILAEHGAYVNTSCGMHVHLDARGTVDLKNRMFKNLVGHLPLLQSIVPKSRRNNYFCRINISDSIADYHNNRYFAINPLSLKKHKTIEVRLHSGTVDATKVNNWIDILSSIAYSKTPIVLFQESILQYIADRQIKFNSTTEIREAA